MGAGGMGEVYLPEELKLERKVALKDFQRHDHSLAQLRSQTGSISSAMPPDLRICCAVWG
jgi:hypothetical protein